jgi:hypothetical protein
MSLRKTNLEMMLELERLRRLEPGSSLDAFLCGASAALKWAVGHREESPRDEVHRLLESSHEARRDIEPS